MNTSNIKKYAPQARLDFIAAVTRRLNLLGIGIDAQGELDVSRAEVSGSVMQIGSNHFDASLEKPRERLIQHCQRMGFSQFAEQMAYTWFNRLCAIRYMELHNYLGHGIRVLSQPDGGKG